ncbi:Uncharacterised protein [Brevibacterium casei]|uniref:Uncharacterized protein n=1 Tax=Brevibacterium casei TaxID=33889 RepID=A0A449CZF1_9MICO|nr:Uncharacterised protein [Brevibacterium casei]
MGWRFATAQDREAIVGMIADAAKSVVRLNAAGAASSPAVFRAPTDIGFSSEALDGVLLDRLLEPRIDSSPRGTRTGPVVMSERWSAGMLRRAGSTAATSTASHPTTSTTDAPSSAIVSRGMSSARNGRAACPLVRLLAQPVAVRTKQTGRAFTPATGEVCQ